MRIGRAASGNGSPPPIPCYPPYLTCLSNNFWTRRRVRMEVMKPWSPVGLGAVLVVALSLCGCGRAVDATVEATCKAAAASDVRVNLELCLSQLSHHRDSPDADTWGLAKVASLVGVNNADLAGTDIKALDANPSSLPMKPALARCARLYGNAGMAFASAYDEINKHAYTAAKQRLDDALSLTQQCNNAFATAGAALPSPLGQRTVESIQIAIIAAAITNLIK